MRLIRQALALLAWMVIFIPTTLFVVLVMIKAFLSRGQAQKEKQA